ncbi:hypothetical protein IEQ34_004280 [Dendrobium chrysotoxum]|uniref:Alcohol dehydrogenase 1 n=1 Tax=Dendrobium chrysotoxum TaxID=161865 RepID=A0AAV7HGP7_DENCH|nr:hypothetical protein IEQ34_004280 [Dendrobium chrysotoxum]
MEKISGTAGQVIRCKAAVAWEAGKPLVIEEVEVAPPEAMEVRVKILYTSLCHSDVHFWEAKDQLPIFPRIFGHEAGGIVESVGKGVTDLAPGDLVLPIFTGECGECADCKSEESNLCSLLRVNPNREVMISDGKSRFSINGKTIFHFLGSTFSQYTVVPSGCVAKINPLAPLDKVFILGCGISTGLGAALNVAKPFKGSTVAIFGLGTVGLAVSFFLCFEYLSCLTFYILLKYEMLSFLSYEQAAEGARMAGASRIIGIDLISKKFDLAKKFGVNEFINPKDYDKPVHEVLIELTDGGVDRSIECTGNVDAMASAFECVRSGWGVAVLVGLPPKNAVLKVNPAHFMMNSKALKGTTFGNYKPRSDIPILVQKYMNKELELEKFITHDVQFSEINKAFEYMHQGGSLRCIIRMDD